MIKSKNYGNSTLNNTSSILKKEPLPKTNTAKNPSAGLTSQTIQPNPQSQQKNPTSSFGSFPQAIVPQLPISTPTVSLPYLSQAPVPTASITQQSMKPLADNMPSFPNQAESRTLDNQGLSNAVHSYIMKQSQDDAWAAFAQDHFDGTSLQEFHDEIGRKTERIVNLLNQPNTSVKKDSPLITDSGSTLTEKIRRQNSHALTKDLYAKKFPSVKNGENEPGSNAGDDFEIDEELLAQSQNGGLYISPDNSHFYYDGNVYSIAPGNDYYDLENEKQRRIDEARRDFFQAALDPENLAWAIQNPDQNIFSDLPSVLEEIEDSSVSVIDNFHGRVKVRDWANGIINGLSPQPSGLPNLPYDSHPNTSAQGLANGFVLGADILANVHVDYDVEIVFYNYNGQNYACINVYNVEEGYIRSLYQNDKGEWVYNKNGVEYPATANDIKALLNAIKSFNQ